MKKLFPLLLLGIAGFIVAVLILFRPEPDAVSPERPVAQVEIVSVQPGDVQLRVESEGTVLPRTETDLAVEVAGRIIEMAPNFRVGGRFEAGDVLFRIDPADYEAALAARRAELADAKLALAQEKALSEQAAADWAAMGEGKPSDLTLRLPQLARAEARIASAEASVQQAERDLARTEVRAPYAGLVLSKSVDLGQYVLANPAEAVARIYATDVAEVRLPLRIEEIDFLIDPAQAPSEVNLSRTARGEEQRWTASLVRFESTIDPQSRLTYAVAEIRSPFEKGLRRGLFVEAEITGRTVGGVFTLPRYALRGSSEVYVVTEADTLTARRVNILKSDASRVIIDDGLAPGEQVATSPIAYFVEGMPVEIIAND